MQAGRWSHGCAAPSVDHVSAIENKKLIEDVFARTATGDMRALSELMAEDFRWVFPGQWSWSGTWGPRSVALEKLLRPLMTQFRGGYTLAADLVLADGDRVVVQASGHGITTGGEPYDQTYCLILRLADGKITEIVEHCDTALVERVLTRPGSDVS
jgi:uncharacterized protein